MLFAVRLMRIAAASRRGMIMSARRGAHCVLKHARHRASRVRLRARAGSAGFLALRGLSRPP